MCNQSRASTDHKTGKNRSAFNNISTIAALTAYLLAVDGGAETTPATEFDILYTLHNVSQLNISSGTNLLQQVVVFTRTT